MLPYLHLGELAIRTYGLLLLLGGLAMVVYIYYWGIPSSELNENHLKKLSRHLPGLILLALILAILGARLAFVIIHWDLFADQPLGNLLAFWRGGLTFHGGLILVLAALILYCFWAKIPLGKLLDLLAPSLALGYAIGRIGCFLNGCCYGYPTDLPWGIVFPGVDQLARHPTQLYAFFLSILVFIVLLRLKRSSTFPGLVFVWWLILHSGYRFIVEFPRVTPPFLPPLSLGQVFTAALIITGLLILLHQSKKPP